MQTVTNYNCDRICHEERCSNIYTVFEIIDYYGLQIHVCLCNNHSKTWIKNKLQEINR